MLPSTAFRRKRDFSRPGEEPVIEASNPESSGTNGGNRRRMPDWLPPLLWAGVVIGASSLSDLRTSASGLEIRDKLAHFGEYFVFGWLVARSFDPQGWSPRKLFLWTAFFGFFLGAVDEFYQGFVPGRSRDGFDLLADTLGAIAGWYFSREDEVVGHTHRAAGNS